jgi:hypothetical protein
MWSCCTKAVAGPSRGPAGPTRPGVSLLPCLVDTRHWRSRTSSRWLCRCRFPTPTSMCALAAASGRLPSMAVQAIPCRVVVVLPPMSTAVSSQSGWPRSVYHGETMMGLTRPWWSMLVGGKLGGAFRLVRRCGFFGVGRNPYYLGTDRWRLCVSPFLPEGRRVYLLPTLHTVPGKP